MIRAILWDVDGTLLDFLASQSVAMKAAYAHFGLGDCSDELVDRYSEINLKYWEALERGEITKQGVLIGRFEEFLTLQGITEVTPEDFCEYYESRLPDTVCYIDNSLGLLKELSCDYKQYAITNGALNVQKRKLHNAGLDIVFDDIFISDEVGYEKPSVGFFNYVLAKIGIPGDELIIVGDSLTSDIKGGNNSGIKACWYNPSSLSLSKPVTVDYEIHHLSEIKALLRAIQ